MMDNRLKEQKKRGTPLYPLQIYHMAVRQKPIFVPYHWHNEVEMLSLLEGNLELIIDGQKFIGEAGDIFIISPEKLHGMSSAGPDTIYNALVFPLEFLSFEMFDYCQCYYLNPLCKKALSFPLQIPHDRCCYREIWLQLSSIDYLNAEKTPGYQLATKAALLNILSILIRDNLLTLSEEKAHISHNQNNLKSVLNYINQNYNKTLYLDDVAKVFSFSPKYFSRYFKRNVNKPFTDYLIYLRVEHACDLLLNTDMQVMNIANEVGFSNFSYFIKKFKDITGYTPAQFRKIEPSPGMYKHVYK